MIHPLPDRSLFILDLGSSQAIIGLYKNRWPVLYHWGDPIPGGDLSRIPAAPNGYSVFGDLTDKSFTPNRLPLEAPWGGAGDFRSPALIVSDSEGTPCVEFTFSGWQIVDGKPDPSPYPGVRPNADTSTLILTFEDSLTGLVVELLYTPLEETLVRRTRVVNRGAKSLNIAKLMSFNVDLFPDHDLDIVALDGAWARERFVRRFDLPAGRWETGSRRGVSSHQAWPGVVLCDRTSTESQGDAWGATLVWSGDWTLSAERDEDGGWRFQGGLHPEFTSVQLAPGQSFSTPEAVLIHSSDGLSGLSQKAHRLVTKAILPAEWVHRDRPIVANNWEATYWAFTEEKLLDLARTAARCGVETFVLDDGWFGHRDDDRSSLGDWVPYSQKFPEGLGTFVQKVRDLGLGFGLWIEPEMISVDSDLYRGHPDWCLHWPGRDRIESRNQLVLDLSRTEVRDYVVGVVTKLLASAPISYVKWDMNRPLSHAGTSRRDWVLGFYDLARRILGAFPDILFEGCCGGGGRMDWGLLTLFPQYWTSDNTDAVARLSIQEGTSLFLPPLVMGAHVSAVPNHQTGRITTWSARTRAAFGGNLGYELDFTQLSETELQMVLRDTNWYKAHRNLILHGEFRRTRTTTGDANAVAWQYHHPSGAEVLLLWFKPKAEANCRFPLYRWQGLEETANYRVEWWADRQSKSEYTGAELMRRGLVIPLEGGDGDGVAVHLTRID